MGPTAVDADLHPAGEADASTLRQLALAVVRAPEPLAKAALARRLGSAVLPVGADEHLNEPPGLPGRPAAPMLVPARDLPRPSVATPAGRAALIHSVAHIEFNAIDLAADIVWRFAGLPDAFYREWSRIAAEEAVHFGAVRDHLVRLGYDYGAFAAHNGLWEMAERTRGDVLARIGLVPRILEARGLDANPAVRRKLVGAGDRRVGEILDMILADEIGHVAAGNRWFHRLCAERGLDPEQAHSQLAAQHRAPPPTGPFNHEARRAAGFTPGELAALETTAAQARRAHAAPLRGPADGQTGVDPAPDT